MATAREMREGRRRDKRVVEWPRMVEGSLSGKGCMLCLY